MINKAFLVKLMVAMILLLTQPLSAGSFHYYLDVTTAVQVDARQQLHAVKMSWVYDEQITGMLLQNQQDLKLLGDVIISDLHKAGYFTNLLLNGKRLDLAQVKAYKLELLKQQGKDKLKLDFTLPLKAPVSFKGKSKLVIDLVDQSGSAMFYHKDASRILLGETLKQHCAARVINKEEFEHSESAQIVTLHCKMP